MKIQEMRTKLSNETGLETIINDYQPCFDEIDAIITELKTDKLSTEDGLVMAQTKLTGLYGSIITVYKMAEATKSNIEAKKWMLAKDEYEKNNPGSKELSAAKLDRMVGAEIGDWRMLRNIFEGYVLAAEKAIITCQSNLKNMKTERVFNNANPERY